MDNRNKTLIVFLLIAVFVCILFFFRKRNDEYLKKEGVLVEARIIKVLNPYKGGVYFSFECGFIFKDKEKTEISPSKIIKQPNDYLGKTYPALYSESTNELRLLMTPDDYNEYGLKYPDSLPEKVK